MLEESKGPAETILQALLSHTDHLYHNRPGMVVADARTKIGMRWSPVTHKVEDEGKVIYGLSKVGHKTVRTRVGVFRDSDGAVIQSGRVVGHYRAAGIFPEVATWMYQQIADVWKMDNEFAAKWASYAFKQEHRDLKVILAAFMLVQSRKGDPEREGGEIIFHDEDFRSVGEAMILLRAEKRDFSPKMLLRVKDVLVQDGVAQINRDLGFGKSLRNPFLGRWPKAVDKWIRYRESNSRVLAGLVKAGFRTSVIKLAQAIGYKPDSDKFFELLRWKQKQAKDGRRSMALNMELSAVDSWDDLSETDICKKITKDKPSYKIIVSKVPSSVGVTRAIMAAAIEAGSLSTKDLIIATPTLEELGLLEVQSVKEVWQAAVRSAEDQRAANIAKNVRSKDTREQLEEASDVAVKKAIEKEMNDLRVYLFVDISGSMQQAITEAKQYLEQFVQAFPLDKLHIACFNTVGREVTIRHASAAGVRAAFRSYSAGGGTDIGRGVLSLEKYKPEDNEDALFIFVTDEGASDFQGSVVRSGINPVAFGLIKVGRSHRTAVTNTAATLNIPCFDLDKEAFSDPYAVSRVLHNLIASTPVGIRTGTSRISSRVSLVDQILQTDLLQKPAWACAS